MFTTKYRPRKLDDFIGNKSPMVMSFIRWLLEWEITNKKTKCALISGAIGSGKSLLVDLVLHKHNYNIIYLSPDEERNKDYFKQTIKPLLKIKHTIDGQENILVINDIDNTAGDYGFISSVTECIKETSIPIICICDDRYSQNIKPIINLSYDIKLPKPLYDDVYRLIYKVVTTEGIKIGKSGADNLYKQSNGDIRFILNSLQMNLKKSDTSKNIQNTNIFDTCTKLLLLDTALDEKVDIYWLARDIHPLMIQENYINNTLTTRNDVTRLANVSYSADALSDMDIIDAVFDWSLEPYVALNTIKATQKCSKKSNLKFPQYLGKISTINKNKREKIDYTTITIKSLKKK